MIKNALKFKYENKKLIFIKFLFPNSIIVKHILINII